MHCVDPVRLGERLLRLRRRRGKSQQLVADFCGISQAALCRYERGQRLPDAGTLFALAAFFGLGLDELCGAAEEFYGLYRAG